MWATEMAINNAKNINSDLGFQKITYYFLNQNSFSRCSKQMDKLWVFSTQLAKISVMLNLRGFISDNYNTDLICWYAGRKKVMFWCSLVAHYILHPPVLGESLPIWWQWMLCVYTETYPVTFWKWFDWILRKHKWLQLYWVWSMRILFYLCL